MAVGTATGLWPKSVGQGQGKEIQGDRVVHDQDIQVLFPPCHPRKGAPSIFLHA